MRFSPDSVFKVGLGITVVGFLLGFSARIGAFKARANERRARGFSDEQRTCYRLDSGGKEGLLCPLYLG